ncbi:MAG: CPXCG motif-containing cysteine-rich protein [Akkermansiaceae bacterium]|nr:CPXCG motif-containing cysteine-rich protein [Akkermansiaceae bacterium]
MQDDTQVQCPWCHEWITLWVAVDDTGSMTMDCEVCCRPMLIILNSPEDIHAQSLAD